MSPMFRLYLFLGAVLTFVNVSTVNAATVSIMTEATNPHQTMYGVRSNTSTFGHDLVGAVVEAQYADGTSESMTWQHIWADLGRATGTALDISMRWAGFDMIATRVLTSLSIDLVPASSIFDIARVNEGFAGNTPTTGIGYPFEIYEGGEALQGSITATYSGIVNLAGRPADGDAYTKMTVDFSGLSGGGFLGSMSFRTDMDTLAVAGDLTPVPLPATFPLMLGALFGFGLLRQRRT